MTPTLQQFSENGKFQPSAGSATASEDSEEQEQPKYTAEAAKNMTDDEAAAVDSKAKGPGGYIGFLRGQVEAHENGQGGIY